MFYLRQATSATVNLGPYTGSDGVALIALSVNRAQIQLSKNGNAFAQKNNTGNGSHQIIGMYSASFDDTDTGSIGRLLAVSSVGTALPVWHEYTVLPTSVFDALVMGTDLFQSDVRQWVGVVPNALISGRVDANAQAIANSLITSAALHSSFRPDANLVAIDSLATNAPSATLNLRRLNVSGDSTSVIFNSNSGVGFFVSALSGSVVGSAFGSAIFDATLNQPLAQARVESSYATKIQSFFTTPTGRVDIGQWIGVAPNALIAGRVDANIGALQNTVITSAALADNAVQKMANLLAVDMSSLSASIAARAPVNALRVLRNRITTSGFFTVYAEDDTTAAWTGTLTTNASAEPIVESNPA